MTDPAVDRERLATLRWHVLRADDQRSAAWSRAAAVLSANALVVAGTAVLAGTGAGGATGTAAVALLPFVASLLSVYQASQVIAGVHDWTRVFGDRGSPAPVLYSLQDTVDLAGDYASFRRLVRRRDSDAELDEAISELWRIGLLHRRRLHQLRWSLRWFVVSIPLLIVSAGVDIGLHRTG